MVGSESEVAAVMSKVEVSTSLMMAKPQIKEFARLTRWLYCVECPLYSIRLKALGYLCTNCLLLAFDEAY